MTTERRQTDNVVGYLEARVQDVAKQGESTANQLSKHVTECAVIQKRVFGAVLFLSGWTVAHSPEAFGLLKSIQKILLPAALP